MKILSVFVLLFLAPAVYGCGCSDLSPEMAFDRAETVFIGKMIGGTEKNIGENKDQSKPKLEAGDVTFDTDSGLDLFKGPSGSRRLFIVRVPSRNGTTCEPYGLVPGEKYIVYASAGGEYIGDPVQAGSCVRIALMTENADIEFIRRLMESGYGTIRGYVSLNTHKLERSGEPYSLPKISLKIIGPDQTSREIQIDKFGNFKVSGLRSGIYRVDPQLPAEYESTRESEEVTIAGFVTHYSSFWVRYKSRVSGTIQDESGVGFDQSDVYLENSTTRVPAASLDQFGKYEIEGVPPGDYVMYMELPNEERRKYYYPGTYDMARATTIKIGLSDSKSGLVFSLPAERRVRNVSGTVVWPGGKPAEAFVVLLQCSDGFRAPKFRPVATDKNGRFSLTGISGVPYWIKAWSEKEFGTVAQSTLLKVTLTKDPEYLKLILSKPGFTADCPVPNTVPSR